MLVPAIVYKEELLKKFAKEMYSDRFFLYTGYAHEHHLPDINDNECSYDWAIVKNDEVVGYLAYRIFSDIDSVERFGLYSFDDPDNSIMSKALTFGKDVYNKMEELISNHHRVSWRVIEGNPVKRSYDALCKAHNGNIVHLNDVTMDNHGNLRGEYIYEIINPEK